MDKLTANELRIGNLVTDEFYDSFKTTIKVESIKDKGINLLIEDDGNWSEIAQRWIGVEYTFDKLRPIPLTEEWLIRMGFEHLPHANLLNSLNYNIGRNRIISIGNVGTPNEMIWICELNDTDKRVINDLVCIRNFDYDGKTYVHTLQNLIHALTGKELTTNQIKNESIS